jgi:[ribosomal protein S18]-alanine N-acetyltransferase
MYRSQYLSRLDVDDIPAMGELEHLTNLAYWGADNYKRFLEEFPEYFGCKVTQLENGSKPVLAAFVLARSLFENLEILKLGVFPRYQRNGFGTMLMEAAYAEGIRRGCTRCFLEVRKSNASAIEFYNRHRFVVVGTRKEYYTDPVEDAWVMERAIG